MLVGKALYAGSREVKTKEGKTFKLIRLLDKENGEFGEFFLGNSARVDKELSMLQPVVVEMSWSMGQRGTRINLVSVSKEQ